MSEKLKLIQKYLRYFLMLFGTVPLDKLDLRNTFFAATFSLRHNTQIVSFYFSWRTIQKEKRDKGKERNLGKEWSFHIAIIRVFVSTNGWK